MNFKKHISLLLAFSLLVSNMGLAFNVHYCGDEIASVSLKSNVVNKSLEDECCGIAEEKTNCCTDKIFHFQKNTEQVVSKIFSSQFDYQFLLQEYQSIAFNFVPNFESVSIPVYYCDTNAPPFFKLYHQYIFYDKF